jgi:hypothetical protein
MAKTPNDINNILVCKDRIIFNDIEYQNYNNSSNWGAEPDLVENIESSTVKLYQANLKFGNLDIGKVVVESLELRVKQGLLVIAADDHTFYEYAGPGRIGKATPMGAYEYIPSIKGQYLNNIKLDGNWCIISGRVTRLYKNNSWVL